MSKDKTRRADGKPETDADKRFFGLRESGYDGPIDQDGRKVASGRAAEILASMHKKGKWPWPTTRAPTSS